jgi:hypothetical protein
MPTNKKEGIIFGSMMCFLMVLGMVTYNLLLHHAFTPAAFFKGLVLGFIVAYILDNFVVGVIAKKIVVRLPFVNKQSKIQMIIAMSCCMIAMMVTCMSVFGVIEGGFATSGNFLPVYFHTWRFNVIVALPLQLLVVGPISRTVLGAIQAKSFDKEAVVKEPSVEAQKMEEANS